MEIQDNLKQRQDKQKVYFDRQTRLLPDVHIGESVRVQQGNVWQPAVIIINMNNQDPSLYKLQMEEHTGETENIFSRLERMDHEAQNTESTESQSHGYITRSGRHVNIPLRYKD